ncbi:MAG: YceD family protein, partial [Silvanigrellaceae bacterium]|nr:YceD family protein [Silvanigrellaceae bacterium]
LKEQLQTPAYQKLNSANYDQEIELNPEDLDVYYYNNQKIYLDEFLLDHLELAIPDLPLCREDCKGLCSQCGAELNQCAELCPTNQSECKHFIQNPFIH